MPAVVPRTSRPSSRPKCWPCSPLRFSLCPSPISRLVRSQSWLDAGGRREVTLGKTNIMPSVSQQSQGLNTLLGRIIPICLQSPSPSSFKIKYLTCRRKSVNRKTYDEILIGLYLSSMNWGSPLYEAPGQRSFRYFKQHSQMSHMVFSSILLAFFVVSCRLTSHSQPDYVVG